MPDRMPGDHQITTDDAASPDERTLHLPLDHHALDLGDGLGGVEALRAGLGAVHDGVAAIEPERVFEIVEPLARRLVAAVAAASDRPAAARPGRGSARRSTNSSGTRSSSRRTGCTRTGRRASARSSWLCLHSFSRRRRGGLQPRLDRGVLRVEVGQVGHEVLHHRHVRQRIDLHRAVDRRPSPWCRPAYWCRRCSSRTSRRCPRGRSGGRSASGRSCS